MKINMRFKLIAIMALGAFTMNAQNSFQEKTTNASNVRLNVTNIGTFGNAFRGYRDGTGDPSAEYPAGSGIEHIFEGGIWIGGRENGGQLVVSTSAYDAPQGYAPGRGGFEFHVDTSITGVERSLQERSSLFDSRFFDPNAVSHQDYIATFSDKSIVFPGTQIPINDHTRPMNIRVEMETYNWNYNFTDFMVIVNLRIYNDGQNTYDDLYTALWNNAVVRNINITPAGAGGSAFYNKGGNGFMDSLHLAYTYDAAGDLGFTESYAGQKFLGASDKEGFHHPDLDSNFNPQSGAWELDEFMVNYNAWVFNDFSADFAFPTTENDRYQKMAQGLNQNPCWSNPNDPACNGRDFQAELNVAGNRSDLLSAGPFNNFAPGDVIEVSFAYVFAKKNEDGNPNQDNSEFHRQNLVSNAGWAQQAYNGEDQNFNGVLDGDEDNDGDGELTRFILPSPPNIPRTRVVPGDGQIEIYWADNAERSIDPISNREDFEGYRIYLSKLGFDVTGVQDLNRDFSLIAQYDKRGNNLFNETGFNSVKLDQPFYFEDDDSTAYHYRYVIDNVPNGWQYATAVTAFDEGNPESNLESLESSFLANNNRAFAGTGPNEDMEAENPFVYPNPYYYGAAWEGKSNFQEESRKIIFANLPARCVIRIYTAGGDYIDEIRHDENYDGGDIRWFRTFGAEDAGENRFSGGEHAWDLLSVESQIISRGLYMYSVEDLDSGEKFTGKFVIIK